MKDGSHEHSLGNRFGLHHHKRTFGIAIFALVFSFVAYASIQSPDIAFEIVVNNTDLAQNGEGGTGERIQGNIYYTNNSAIQLFIKAHSPANQIGILSINISINGTVVQSLRQNVSVIGGDEWLSVPTIVPKNSNYSVSVFDYHHYEWREYPILSGQNGTLSINQTIVQGGGGGISFNGSVVDLNGSSFYNGTQQSGTFNHSNLTNLDWFNSGHYNVTINESQVINLNNDLNNRSNLTRRTMYYVELTGSDSNDCLSVATACRTFQHVWNLLANNSVLYGDVDIVGGHGKFYEADVVPALFYDGFNVTVYGQMNNTNLGTATTGVDPVYQYSGSMGYVQKDGAGWTTNQYQNKLLMNPSGQIATIASNNATRINYTLSPASFTKFSAGQTITVMDWNTTIECDTATSSSDPILSCVKIYPNGKLMTKYLKIVNNNTLGSIGVSGDVQVVFQPQYSYIEGYGNTGAVYLTTNSYINTLNSVFVGDGYEIRLEGSSKILDRNAASIYYMKSTINSGKAAMLLSGSEATLNEGFYINGVTKAAGTRGVYAQTGSRATVLQGFIDNVDTGVFAQFNSVVLEASFPKYLNVNTNISPSGRIDNSSVI